jgi:probable addiction module antidote protein
MNRKSALKAFDVVDFLDSEANIAAYMNAVLDEAGDDPAFIAQSLGHIARARGMSRIAKQAGLSRESLYRALSGDGNPEFGTILKVFKALGLRLQTL